MTKVEEKDAARCMLTKRGKRVFEVAAAWFGWSLGMVLVMGATLAEALPVAVAGIILLMASATWTCVLAINRQTDVVRTAYELGRAVERGGSPVVPMR